MSNSMLVGAYEYWELLNLNASINGNNLTNNGSPLVTFESGPVAGEGAAVFLNNAWEHGGIPYPNQYLWCPSNANLVFGDRDWEMAFWWQWNLSHSAHGSQAALLMKGDDNNGFYEYYPSYQSVEANVHRGTDNVITTNGGSNYYHSQNETDILANVWQFVDQWYVASERRLYEQIDGGAVLPGDIIPGGEVLDVTAMPMGFGGWGGTDGSDGSGYLDGKLASVARFNTLRTTGQRTLLYGGGAGLPFSQWDSGAGASNNGGGGLPINMMAIQFPPGVKVTHRELQRSKPLVRRGGR